MCSCAGLEASLGGSLTGLAAYLQSLACFCVTLLNSLAWLTQHTAANSTCWEAAAAEAGSTADGAAAAAVPAWRTTCTVVLVMMTSNREHVQRGVVLLMRWLFAA
jgi:hypothetical protein